MSYDSSYNHGIAQIQKTKTILPSNLETTNLYHYIVLLGLFVASRGRQLL